MLPLLFSILYVIAIWVLVKILLGIFRFFSRIFQERHVRCGYRPRSTSPQISVLEEKNSRDFDLSI